MGGLTHGLLQRRSGDAQEIIDRIALYVLQREQIFDDSVLRDARIAALAPPLAAVVIIVEWLQYVDWEGYASARHTRFDSMLEQLSAGLQRPLLAEQLQQAASVRQFEALRPVLLGALLEYIEQHIGLFP